VQSHPCSNISQVESVAEVIAAKVTTVENKKISKNSRKEVIPFKTSSPYGI
jgi:hypothetical protein